MTLPENYLIGERFGRLLVIKKDRINYWQCKCDCGNEKIVRKDHLLSGKIKSCGCLLTEIHIDRITDLIGKKFNKLTVISFYGRKQYDSGGTRLLWKCECDCGNIKILSGDELKHGNTKSCGCTRYDGKGIETVYNTILLQIKNGAKSRNLIFDLSDDDVKSLIHQKCFYCGKIDIKTNRSKKSHPKYELNGIDRIDSSQGYTIENTVPCCRRCNEAKMSETKQDFYSWIKQVFNNLSEKGEI